MSETTCQSDFRWLRNLLRKVCCLSVSLSICLSALTHPCNVLIKSKISRKRFEAGYSNLEHWSYLKYHPTGYDVISYFRSRVGLHFVRFKKNFSIRYLKIGSTQIHQVWNIDWQRCFLCTLHTWHLSINPLKRNNAKTFLDTHAYISEITQHI